MNFKTKLLFYEENRKKMFEIAGPKLYPQKFEQLYQFTQEQLIIIFL